jgi:hypothetical protein
MVNIVADFTSQLHDNKIKSYFVDFTEGILKMETSWYDKENTTIEFSDLLAHKFNNVINSNIIYGLYQTTIQSYIDEESETLSEELQFGFPSMKPRNCNELKQKLEEEKYKVFYIDSSLGLSGYVIAKDINIINEPSE